MRSLIHQLHALLESSKEKKFGEYILYATAYPHKNEWNVEAYIDKPMKQVGLAEFAGVYEYPDSDSDEPPYRRKLVALKGWNVEVAPEHRRKGLASAMYTFAEEAFELPIRPGSLQTPAGEKFLKRKRR